MVEIRFLCNVIDTRALIGPCSHVTSSCCQSATPGMSPASHYSAYSTWSLATYQFFSLSKTEPMLGFLVLKVSLTTILYDFSQQIFWIFRNRNKTFVCLFCLIGIHNRITEITPTTQATHHPRALSHFLSPLPSYFCHASCIRSVPSPVLYT